MCKNRMGGKKKAVVANWSYPYRWLKKITVILVGYAWKSKKSLGYTVVCTKSLLGLRITAACHNTLLAIDFNSGLKYI
jgi:hypothetical protein